MRGGVHVAHVAHLFRKLAPGGRVREERRRFFAKRTLRAPSVTAALGCARKALNRLAPSPARARAKRGLLKLQRFHSATLTPRSTCPTEPIKTEPGWDMHTASDVCVYDFQANRAPDHRRTSPLNGLWTHFKGGIYHDGRFATLLDVVNHYGQCFNLGLSAGREVIRDRQ
jgi:hypothetical protein